jgi:lipopolysaccharide/colanic/teichoic acid biosynthesis glycosyltransferase
LGQISSAQRFLLGLNRIRAASFTAANGKARGTSTMGDSYSSGHPLAGLFYRPASTERAPGTPAAATTPSKRIACFEEDAFHATLTCERRRAERSRKPFFLMLLDAHHNKGQAGDILFRALPAVSSSIRETDVLGWYEKGAILAVIFTEVGDEEREVIAGALRAKIGLILQQNLGAEQAQRILMSLHVFPDNWDAGETNWSADSKLYPDVPARAPRKKASLVVKRAIDLAGSLALLLLLSPVLATIALLIKLTSKGPVLFAQERMGQLGVRFKCLKFRTMYSNCDPKIHQEYIQQFIAGRTASSERTSDAPVVYKITNDPRVTPIGRFLRKTSLDELPQFWNVFRGDMSLVGPRPPVPYEFEIYEIWHRRRVLEVQPGITGLWQVNGRSRLEFDDMVRLDLRYCQSWSLWLDLKILLATPRAVFSGDGAY